MKIRFNPLATAVIAALLLTINTTAQIRIGSNDAPEPYSLLQLETAAQGGLRLPQLTNDEREAITTEAFQNSAKSKGLVIYNTTARSYEYWNGTKWISLYQGQAEITFTDRDDQPVDPTAAPFLAEGENRGPFTTHDKPECRSQNPAFDFQVVTGSEYFTIDVIDPSVGEFMADMETNPTAATRIAIVRITDRCTNESKDFLFTQLGDASGCGETSTVPAIKSYSNGGADNITFCQGGSVSLYLDGLPTDGTYIWSLNGQELGEGNTFTATLPGLYVVYGDKIGCSNKSEKRVALALTGTPEPVQIVAVGNNGIACGGSATVDLIVTQPLAGDIKWYKDSELQPGKTGARIQAGAGSWYAVVESAGCSSAPTDPIEVSADLNATVLPTPVMKINGLTADYKLCRNGSMYLEVDAPDATQSYTWYIDNTVVGTGSGIYIPVPAYLHAVLRLRATGMGCAAEALSEETVQSGEIPAAPLITASTGDVLCGGSATLFASGGSSYHWFKDGNELPGEITGSLEIRTTGSYAVTAVSAAGCVSAKSATKEIRLSDFATVQWLNVGSHPNTANETETKVYAVSVDLPLGAIYTWTVTGGGVVTDGQGTSRVTVNFPVPGANVVRCSVRTDCGSVLESPVEQAVEVVAKCTNPQIMNHSLLNPTIKQNYTTTLSVTASGTPALTYQWYKDVKPAATTPVGTDASYILPTDLSIGTHNYYCVVSTGTECKADTSSQFTVTVVLNPANLNAGVGTFSGRSCFDIRYSDSGEPNSCRSVSNRLDRQTSFKDRTAAERTSSTLTGVQIYNFTPSAAVSHVRFDYAEVDNASGLVIDSIVPSDKTYATKNAITGKCSFTVYYKANLGTTLRGLSRNNALKVKLYVIYNSASTYANASNDKRLEMIVNLQDCACCGAKNASGNWVDFMCHNLGADESLDPFTWSNTADGDNTTPNGVPDDVANQYKDIKGWLFQWGRKADGHQYRNSTYATSGWPTIANYAANPTNYPYFYQAYNQTANDWTSSGTGTAGYSTRWNPVTKGVNDPCPTGWRVPGIDEWRNLFCASCLEGHTYADMSTLPNGSNTYYHSNMLDIGKLLSLPKVGSRGSSTVPFTVPETLIYSTSSTASTAVPNIFMLNLTATNEGGSYGNHYYFNNYTAKIAAGYPVRCVAE